jgi:S1-C subfamily serine protease
MNKRNNSALAIGLGCALLLLCIAGAVAVVLAFVPAVRSVDVFRDTPFEFESAPFEVTRIVVPDNEVGLGTPAAQEAEVDVPAVRATQGAIATLPAAEREATGERGPEELDEGQTAFQPGAGSLAPFDENYLSELYRALNPGVVAIRVLAATPFGPGDGAGSGFIIDEAGHIVTNEHVVQGADLVTVIFYDGFEAEAEVVGGDDDSDLAVLRVSEMPEGAYALPIGDSNEIQAGEWVVAIGNPFGFSSSMTLGIVSAVGRAIPGLVPDFSIPQVIQTDAPINPGNSGGPLINMRGEVIGVNAQIRTADGVRANSGVGFAIPSNIVRLVAPVLIETGSYQWPYLGVRGYEFGVDLALQVANNLPDQLGAYVAGVMPDTPAAAAGLQGSSGRETILGRSVEVGGDVIVAFDGDPIIDFADMLSRIAFSEVGDEVVLTVRRGDDVFDVPVTLAARPSTVGFGEELEP